MVAYRVKVNPEALKKIEDTYSEDIQSLIDVNRKDLDNWVNVEYNGVVIPMTTQEKTLWDSRKMKWTDKRVMADEIERRVRSGTHEYFSVKGVLLLREITHEERIELATFDQRKSARMNGIKAALLSIFKR